MKNDRLQLLGQISGYSAAGLSLLDIAKDIFGLIGLICGAILSAWALIDRIRRARQTKNTPEGP